MTDKAYWRNLNLVAHHICYWVNVVAMILNAGALITAAYTGHGLSLRSLFFFILTAGLAWYEATVIERIEEARS